MGCRSTASALSLVAAAAAVSSCQSGCCRGCSGVLCWKNLPPLHGKGLLTFQGSLAKLAPAAAFAALLKPLRWKKWFVYIKEPFAGPKAVLAYLSRYTHRVAISNTRLIAHDERGVTFRYKDYRTDGLTRRKIMTLAADEFIRRFMLHILPKGFHRIRHYGLFANTGRADNIARLRELLGSHRHLQRQAQVPVKTSRQRPSCRHVPCCGGRMIVIEFFERGMQPRLPAAFAACHPDRYVMSWNVLLEAHMPSYWPLTTP